MSHVKASSVLTTFEKDIFDLKTATSSVGESRSSNFKVTSVLTTLDKMKGFASVVVVVVFVVGFATFVEGLGREVGSFKTRDHGVNGTVFITGEETLAVRGFSYDGV